MIAKSIVKHKELNTYHVAYGMSPSYPLIQVFAVSTAIADRDDINQDAPIEHVATWNCRDSSTKPEFDALVNSYLFRHGGSPRAARDNS